MAFRKSTTENKKKELTYEVIENYGCLTKRHNEEEKVKEFRFVSWNGREPKYDIRPWYKKDGVEYCEKGITLEGDECETLLSLLQKIAEDDSEETEIETEE